MNITVGSQVLDDQKNTYTITDAIGKGGFGAVYKAVRDTDHCEVAVKVFSADFASKEGMLSYQRELQRSLLVKSDYVIDYLYVHDGSKYSDLPPYIIMEYADGGSLADILRYRRNTGKVFSSDEITELFIQLSIGMKAVNQVLVHRDIKPENILICGGKPKISDFGLSKIAADTTKTLTFKGYGSVKYVAPEAWDNDHTSVQMDIYSMGIVFYEIATLSYPYSISVNADYSTYRNAHYYQAPNSDPLRNSNLSAGVVSAVIKMMDKPTQTRYSNWDSIINAIVRGNDISPDNSINSAVERALSARNAYDVALQESRLSAIRQEDERNNHILLIYSYFENSVVQPIREYIDQFNSKYQGQSKFKLHNAKDVVSYSTFSISINTPIGDKIAIETEVLFPNDSVRRVGGYYKCNGRDVLSWSCVSDSYEVGFNLLLLKNPNSMYGDWFIMESRNSGLSRSHRVEPFGFSISELPKEIGLINATHIYKSKVMPLDLTYIYDYLGKHVSY